MEQFSFKKYQKETLQAARDLCYSEEVLTKIKEAKNEADICRAMISARQKER